MARDGYTVALHSRSSAEAGKRMADELAGASYHQADLADDQAIRDLVAAVLQRHGRLDVLVNNAAVPGAALAGKPSETPPEALRQVFETNVFGVVAVTNALLPLLRRSPAGRIVNVSSELGSIGAALDPDSPCWPFVSIPYPTSKTAVNMITAMYAKELADTPIKVNAANPGYCATDLNGHTGFRTAAQGAEAIVHLATLADDGPTGSFHGHLWVNDPAPDQPEYGSLRW
jgi:NAD(P)-dependent dehydrogenase (short-subunit alcohol dehydrogenase family)